MKHADFSQSSLVAQMVKNLPAVQEMWVRSLGWEDLMKGMATHFSILAWRIPWTEEPGGLQFMGSKESDTAEHTRGTLLKERAHGVNRAEGRNRERGIG